MTRTRRRQLAVIGVAALVAGAAPAVADPQHHDEASGAVVGGFMLALPAIAGAGITIEPEACADEALRCKVQPAAPPGTAGEYPQGRLTFTTDATIDGLRICRRFPATGGFVGLELSGAATVLPAGTDVSFNDLSADGGVHVHVNASNPAPTLSQSDVGLTNAAIQAHHLRVPSLTLTGFHLRVASPAGQACAVDP